MFGTIRKHQTWLWAVIITLTIISFVVFFSPYAKMNANVRGSGEHGSINGRKITDQQFNEAYKDVVLHHFVTSGRWPGEEKSSDFNPERQTYEWLLIVQKQEDLGVHPSNEAVDQMGRNIIRNFERIGVTSPQIFFEQVLKPRGLSVADFERFVEHFLGIQELINTVGASGKLIPPDQAKTLYERDHQEVSTEAVFFWASNFEASVQVPPEALTQFYSNQVALYHVPERVQVAYVAFGATNYLLQAEQELTNLTELVEVNYQRIGTNAFPEAKTPDEAKAKIRERILKQQAQTVARLKARDFSNLLNEMTPVKAENLRLVAASNNVPAQVSEPFDRDSTPKGLDVNDDFTKRAFALSPDEPFSTPVAGTEAVYIMAFERRLPAETPTFDQIRERVTADYRRSQARRMTQQAAITFANSVTNGIAQGKSFTNVCAEANLKPISLSPFSISTHSVKEAEGLVRIDQLKQAAFSTEPGKASVPVPTSEGAMVLFVNAKLPIDPAREQSEMPAYLTQLRRTRQQEAFEAWLQRERDRGLRDTPLARPAQPPGMTTKSASAQ